MKKASKVLLIISGIFNVIVTLAFFGMVLLFCFAFVAVLFAQIVGIVSLMVQSANLAEGELPNVLTRIIPIVAYSILGLIEISIIIVVLGFGGITSLLATIFNFKGVKKNSKKSTHILGIVFSTLTALTGILWLLSGVYALIILLLLWFVILILLLTPVGWAYIGFVIISFGSILVFILAIIGNIFGLIAIAKKKKEEENQPLEIIENVE